MKKMMCMMTLGLALMMGSGCVSGDNGFALTKGLYKWNKKDINGK